MPDPFRRVPPLTVVEGDRSGTGSAGRSEPPSYAARDVEWSILMARAQDGDAAAYRRLLETVTPYLRSIAARRRHSPSDADDVVQDVLLTMHAIRQTYDPQRPFTPWLVTIANRRIADRLRRQGRVRARETVLTAEHETFAAGQANIDGEISDRRELQTALGNLPTGQRQAIELLKLKEMSLKDAAAVTGMSVAALKVATHRALRSLRHLLAPRSGQP